MRSAGLPALALMVAGCASTASLDGAAPLIAITVDDLPVHGAAPAGETPITVAREMIAALRREGVPAHGFINGQRTEAAPETMAALTAWRDARLPLGNHGWSHRHLSEMSPAEFEDELASNEPLLRRLSPRDEWRWFRYPFLDEGDSSEKRAAARAILARRGYRVAAVTMDFSDWQWTDPYARCSRAGDTAAIEWLERSYLLAARENTRYARHLARQVEGRDIPYVLLLHVGGMSARMMPQLLALFRAEGFRFVTLAEAKRDPFYRQDVEPALPPRAQGLEGRARERGIPLPPRTNYGPELEAACRPATAR